MSPVRHRQLQRKDRPGLHRSRSTCLMTADAGLGAESRPGYTALSCGETMEECEHPDGGSPTASRIRCWSSSAGETAKGEKRLHRREDQLPHRQGHHQRRSLPPQGRRHRGAHRPGHLLREPKVPEKTDITVVSVVGRFLEHSRIYRFGRAGDSDESSASPRRTL